MFGNDAVGKFWQTILFLLSQILIQILFPWHGKHKFSLEILKCGLFFVLMFVPWNVLDMICLFGKMFLVIYIIGFSGKKIVPFMFGITFLHWFPWKSTSSLKHPRFFLNIPWNSKIFTFCSLEFPQQGRGVTSFFLKKPNISKQ